MPRTIYRRLRRKYGRLRRRYGRLQVLGPPHSYHFYAESSDEEESVSSSSVGSPLPYCIPELTWEKPCLMYKNEHCFNPHIVQRKVFRALTKKGAHSITSSDGGLMIPSAVSTHYFLSWTLCDRSNNVEMLRFLAFVEPFNQDGRFWSSNDVF